MSKNDIEIIVEKDRLIFILNLSITYDLKYVVNKEDGKFTIDKSIIKAFNSIRKQSAYSNILNEIINDEYYSGFSIVKIK